MPTIIRPDTDIKRLAALRAAKAKANVTAPADLAFSAATLAVLNALLPTFETEMNQRGAALAAQTTASAAANPARRACGMYVSHFIQVLNFGIEREEYPASARNFYQLPVEHATVPALRTDAERIQWANNIVAGEANRVGAGGAPMSNPTAGAVGNRLTALNNALGALSPAKDAYDRELEDVAAMRPDVDDLIDDIWDEVLFTFRKDDPASQRRKAREYGLTYRPNPGELPSPSEYSLQGKATNLITGAPEADVEVRIEELGVTVLTDIDGTYLLPLVAPGTYTIAFRKFGYIDVVVPNTVIAAGTIPTLNAQMKEVA